MKWKVFLFVLILGAQTTVFAGYDEGKVAYDSKDYATALAEWQPLALEGNAITFASSTRTVCTVNTTTVTVQAAGTCTLTADQAGNAYYSAAQYSVQN